MRRILTTVVLLASLLAPTMAAGQSGDASWLENLDGLQTGIGRSWMAPIEVTEVYTETEYNEQGTPVHEISGRTEPVPSTPGASPVVGAEPQTMMMSVFLFEFDSEESAAAGTEMVRDEQLAVHERDPRSPEMNPFTVDLGDSAYGYEGDYTLPMMDTSDTINLSVVYLFVQDGNLTYQLFGQFLPGDHQQIATNAIAEMIAAEPGNEAPVMREDGTSTGGMWEKFNAVTTVFPPNSTMFDLNIWPMGDTAGVGEGVAVPTIDMENLGATPGLEAGWHITYGPEEPVDATDIPEGVYSIEVWVLEFTDETNAGAASFALQSGLYEPLGITDGMSGSTMAPDGQESVVHTGNGYVRDRSLPEGDAAVRIVWTGSTVYAVRVYSNGPAPSSVAENVMQYLLETPAGSGEEMVEGTTATGGGWERFPQPGNELVYDLQPVVVEAIQPGIAPATPVATPQ